MSGQSPTRLAWLSPVDPPQSFPPLAAACDEPQGLLAAGGDLSEARLIYAYRHGIFPWYSDGEPILWWTPDPRCVLRPEQFHLARRLRRTLQNSDWCVTFNTRFDDVIGHCAGKRFGQPGTWITEEMTAAYQHLHRAGWAHSVEVWDDSNLVGGLYGLAIGRVFFGESMFSRADNGSKIAMLALCRHLQRNNFAVLDCQVESPHLLTLGATQLPREDFAALLEVACEPANPFAAWPERSVGVAALGAP